MRVRSGSSYLQPERGDDALRANAQVAVGERHQLGTARGAGGVHHQGGRLPTATCTAREDCCAADADAADDAAVAAAAAAAAQTRAAAEVIVRPQLKEQYGWGPLHRCALHRLGLHRPGGARAAGIASGGCDERCCRQVGELECRLVLA